MRLCHRLRTDADGHCHRPRSVKFVGACPISSSSIICPRPIVPADKHVLCILCFIIHPEEDQVRKHRSCRQNHYEHEMRVSSSHACVAARLHLRGAQHHLPPVLAAARPTVGCVAPAITISGARPVRPETCSSSASRKRTRSAHRRVFRVRLNAKPLKFSCQPPGWLEKFIFRLVQGRNIEIHPSRPMPPSGQAPAQGRRHRQRQQRRQSDKPPFFPHSTS